MKIDHELLEGLEQAMGYLADEAKEDASRRDGYNRASAKIRQLYDNLCEEMKAGIYSNEANVGVRYTVGIKEGDAYGMVAGPYTQLHMAQMEVGRENAFILEVRADVDAKPLYEWNHEESEWERIKEQRKPSVAKKSAQQEPRRRKARQ